jgi:hypothetical protein
MLRKLSMTHSSKDAGLKLLRFSICPLLLANFQGSRQLLHSTAQFSRVHRGKTEEQPLPS